MDATSRPVNLNKTMLAIAAALLMLFAGAGVQQVIADHQPADKAAVAGSGVEIMGTPVTEGSSSEEVELFRTQLKSSNPSDLLMAVTLECAIWTDVTVVGNDESEAVATVKVWIEMDGEPVPVASDDDEETGKVVFCNRAYKMALTNVDDEDMQIDQYLSTRSANAFNWITLNVGSGTHDIVVKAQLDAEVTGSGMAKAGIGKRTLIVEPTKLANDITI